MRKELTLVRAKKKRLTEKRDELNNEIKFLENRERELEDEEIVAICRKNSITIEDLMEKVRQRKEKRNDDKEKKND